MIFLTFNMVNNIIYKIYYRNNACSTDVDEKGNRCESGTVPPLYKGAIIIYVTAEMAGRR